MNRLITARQIHDGLSFLPENTIIELQPDGVIVALHQHLPDGRQPEYFDGILMPGFVNAHCHLELSHLKGAIPEATGLPAFLASVPAKRNVFSDKEKHNARWAAYNELLRNGIVAIGDIANSTDTLDIRADNKLHVHTFVECMGFVPQFAQARFNFSKEQYEVFNEQSSSKTILSQSIVPHAPYSVSKPLFAQIDAYLPQAVISVHNQETEAENEFYKSKIGDFLPFYEGMGINVDYFEPTGKSSLQSYLPLINKEHSVMLVHNTCTSAEDIAFALQQNYKHLFWCLCPNANWYIERKLPNVPMLAATTDAICIGTDSLASNHQLSIWDELLTLKKHFSELSWETLIRWATYNGAKALRMDDRVGMIISGKQPGIVCITDLSDSGQIQVVA